MVLPEPVLSDDDLKVAEEVNRNPSSLISVTWSKDPTKLAILRALDSCRAHSVHHGDFLVGALAQKPVCFLHSYSLEVEEVHC